MGKGLRDTVLATAILDRLLHHSRVLNIGSESYRPKEKRRAGLFGPSQIGMNDSAPTEKGY